MPHVAYQLITALLVDLDREEARLFEHHLTTLAAHGPPEVAAETRRQWQDARQQRIGAERVADVLRSVAAAV